MELESWGLWQIWWTINGDRVWWGMGGFRVDKGDELELGLEMHESQIYIHYQRDGQDLVCCHFKRISLSEQLWYTYNIGLFACPLNWILKGLLANWMQCNNVTRTLGMISWIMTTFKMRYSFEGNLWVELEWVVLLI